MKLCLKLLAIAVIATVTYSLTSCAAPASFSYQNITISLSPQCSDCQLGLFYNPAQPNVFLMSNNGGGGTVLWTATVTNAPPTSVQWAIYPLPNLNGIGTPPNGSSTPVGEQGSSVGSFSATSGNTAYYVQNGVPIYSGAALQQANTIQWTQNGVGQTGIPQGDVLLVASVPTSPNAPNCTLQPITPGCVSQGQLVQLFNETTAQGPPTLYLVPKTPTNPSGLTTPVATVSHLAPNNTFQFYGGAVGASPCFNTTTCGSNPLDFTDNSVIWEVGTSTTNAAVCTTPALCPEGTISATGLYTAPAVVPPSPPVIVLAAHILTTITAVAYLAVN